MGGLSLTKIFCSVRVSACSTEDRAVRTRDSSSERRLCNVKTWSRPDSAACRVRSTESTRLCTRSPVGTVAQKDQPSVTHQFDAFVSARRIDIKFCCYRHRAILRRRQPAWVKALGKGRARRRLETQAFGKVDRDLQAWNNTDDNHNHECEPCTPQESGNDSSVMRC